MNTLANLRLPVLMGLLFLFGNLVNGATLPPGFAEVLVAQNLDPTAMALAPDGRLFILEKNGRVLIVSNGQLLPDPFIELAVDNYNERGLSGIAFDPGFAQNGYLYLYYTVPGANHNRVSRFKADGNYVMAGSETVLLDLDGLSGTIHNAGSMAFGIDGKLYISVGDGANGGNAQSLNSLLGKVLRINADGSIPNDNPFYTQTSGKYRAIYALGLRNSFSLTIQPGTGRIFASEVGNADWEEVNEIIGGKNYGWPIIEGPIAGQTPPNNYKEPVFAYDHSQGCAAVGAVFYNPQTSMFPAAYQGKYFFADYCKGHIKYLDPNVSGVANTFATNINRPLNMVVAPDGTLYYIARAGLGGGSMVDNTSTNDGTLWRVFYNGSGAPFVSVNPQPVFIPQGEDASFFTVASGLEPFSYQWQRNEVNIPGANAAEYTLANAMLSDSGAVFRCIITNSQGADTTLNALLRVTSSHRPVPVILMPTAGTTYIGGDILQFEGTATDQEDGTLPPAALRWKIDFHHNTHTHPGLMPTSGIASGSYEIPQTGETSDNVWYRIYLTATDASGLSQTVSREVFPKKTVFHILSNPSNVPVNIDGTLEHTPHSQASVVGILRNIQIDQSILTADSIYLFNSWSDGETSALRGFLAPEDTLTFQANYEKYPLGTGTGLRGYFYDGLMYDPTFYEPYKFTWIDTTINFDWGESSPAPTQLGDDFWLVRWEGYVEPLFNDNYNFHVVADDGIRLWVADQLIIDQWVPQAPTEATGSIALQGGVQYPIRLEYFEEAGGAVCKLSWSSSRLAKSIIPKSQMYPELVNSIIEIDNAPVLVYPNPTSGFITIESAFTSQQKAEIQVVNTMGQVLLRQTEQFNAGISKKQISLSSFPAGIYWVKINIEGKGSGVVKIVKV